MQDGRLTSAGSLFQKPAPHSGEKMNVGRESQIPPREAGERLRAYDRVKLCLASLVQRMLRLIDEQTDSNALRQCRELLANLAEDRFTLAVVGQFNRGKSSLMNAVLGLDRLPVGVVPLTSVITRVSYGNPERALIEFQRSSLKSEISLDQLAGFVTETGNPGNSKRILAAEVQLPSEFLRRGLFLVDTPGIGSAIVENTVTTEQFLPQADAVIFVTSFDSPLGREELSFLAKVREYVRKVFFVINKLDLIESAHRDQVLAFIQQRLEREAGLHQLRLFAASALIGLQAKLSGSGERLAESGLPALEENLVQFLTTEKTREFLVRTCDRALSILGDLGRGTVEGEKRGAEWVGTCDQFIAREAGHDPQATGGDGAIAIDDIFARMMRLRAELLWNSTDGGERTIGVRLAAKSIPEAEVMEAARRPCRVCAQVADAMMKFMANFQYQIVVNENERAGLASRGGLCPLHTWQYAEIASPQGISSSYPPVLTEVSSRLSELAHSESPNCFAERANKILAKGDRCRACHEQAITEDKVLREIMERATKLHDQEALRLPVLCLPHLIALLRRVPGDNLKRALLEFEAALFERLAENMKRYSLRHDALRRGLNSEDERNAYHRGLSQLVGDKRLQAPWRVERLV